MNKTDRQVIDELVEKWSAPDHDCPFGKMTRDRLCNNYDNCKDCVKRNAFNGLR